jgi:hypothetical protein
MVHCSFRGGFYDIFWGAAWQGAQSALATHINQFFDVILTSALIDQLGEYSVPAYHIGHGRRTGTITFTSPAPARSVSDTAIQHMLQQEISTNHAVPHPTPNTLYFVYVPPGVRVVQGGSASCQAFCGYHNDMSGQVFYAVMPYPGCPGCLGNLTPGRRGCRMWGPGLTWCARKRIATWWGAGFAPKSQALPTTGPMRPAGGLRSRRLALRDCTQSTSASCVLRDAPFRRSSA